MKLPSGFEAILAPRSSSFKKYLVLQTNSIGVIDNSYSGNSDEWGWPVVALGKVEIPQYTRVCQFRIQPSHFRKLQYGRKLSGYSLRRLNEYVDNLDSEDRGGFGSTGTN